VFTKRIHVFKSGDQTSAQGVQRTFTPDDLQQVVDTYDPSVHEAPLVLGHQGDNDSLPSFGWIQGFKREGPNLYADVAFTDTAKDLVKDGHYRKVSISFYSPDSQINPHNGKWSARHLALLGASPPAVKGLEPFSFAEKDGCFDFAVALSPSDIFDDELGPTLIVEKSPLEMLREKLEEVRQDVSSAVKDLQESGDQQKVTQVDQAAGSSAPAEIANMDSGQQYSEGPKSKKQTPRTNEITQQTAELEDQFPEEQFMEDGKISRKHAKGAHGQVMQVVENVYDEQHGELPPALKKKAAEMKAKAKHLKPGEKVEMDEMEMDAQHKELPPALKKRAAEVQAKGHFAEDDDDEMEFDEVSYKTNPSAGVVKFGTKKESDDDDDTGRFETARSSDDGYGDRMSVGKEGSGGVGADRMNTAKSGKQEADRLNTPKNAEQDADRKRTAKDASENANGESRWAGQADAEDRVENMDQYDVDKSSYGVNAPKTASGSNPAGREDSDTKFPTETEESPDDTVFAVSTINVMSDGSMRVMRQKSSDGRASVKGGKIDHAEPEADEMTSELGVTAMGEVDDDLVQGKAKLKKGQLDPGQFEGGVAQITGPDGVFSEKTRGEKKSSKRQLVPAAMDEVDESAQVVGPEGAFAEDNLSGDFEGGPNQTSKRSGGVFAEEHGEKKNPYTKTGFGSTYDEDGDDDADEEEYNEFATDHCGMNYGMGSMAQPNPVGFPEAMYEELNRLKKEHSELQRRFAEEKMATRKAKIASFVESIYEEGRLTDGIMPQSELQSYCEGLDFGTLEFSEGETAATKLLGLLSKLPPVVSYGEFAGGTFQYAEEDLDPHSKALKMVESEGIDYVEALKRTMYS